MAETIKAGVLGLRRGRSLLRVLQALPGAEVVIAADADDMLVERVCREDGVPRGGASLDDLLRAGVDLVVIATPPPLHTAAAVQALDAGAHVLSEVPAVTSQAEAETLIAAVERSGRQYMMGENCCYWAVVDTAKQLHARGDFGTLFHAEAEYIHDVRGMMRDAQGQPTWRHHLPPITYITHSLGPLLWVTGQYPEETTCYGSAGNYEPGMTDVQVALFRLSGGAVARVTISFGNAHWQGHRYAFFGTQASLDTGWIGLDQPKYWSTGLPNVKTPVHLPVGTNFAGAPAAAVLGGHGTAEWYMARAFLDAIGEGRRPPIDVYDAAAYSVAGLAADESFRTGRAVPIAQYRRRRPSA